jgi:ABC-type sugar transport system ATPase subunit
VSTLELQTLHKRFDQVEVIHGVDLQVQHGQFVVFVGPSGCGKSTLLRLIAGLDEATSGQILIDGQRVNEVGAADRGCAMVFQSYALYPHMTVYDNMAFGLENAKVPRAQIESKIQAAAAMLRLDTLLQRRPTQLSGGQRQRVAIGRAIVREPKIFLFDEPLSNLDAELRVSMRAELRELHDRLGSTMIYVTHDQVEAMTMADQIVVLRAGRIEQVGSPQELYERPCNTFVAGFIGSPRMNFLPLAALPPGSALAQSLPPGTTQMGVRPEHWQLTGTSGSGSNGLPLTVLNAEYLGAQRLVRASLNASASSASVTLEILIPGEVPLSPGGQLTVWAEPAHVHAFNDAGLRLPGTAT